MIRSCGCGEDISKELGNFSKCDVCNVRGTLDIFKEFNEVYRERFKETELAAGDATELKLKTLQDWVADLTEQNTVLVETVEALEKEALYRLEIGMNAQRCADLETKQPGSIKDRLMFSQDGELDSFKKKNYDNGKLKFLDDHHTHDTLQEKKECKVCRSRRTVGFSHSSDELHNRGVDSQLQETEDKLDRAQMEIEKLKQNLIDNEQKLEKINEDIIASEKSAREMRAALTAEVADKHDQVLALRRDVQHLEEKLRQADMQTHFKDDIIKELRKEIKIANNKLGTHMKDKLKMSSAVEDSLRNVKFQLDRCSGCSSVVKVLLPQLSTLQKRVDSAICELRLKFSSSNRFTTQMQCYVEELLTGINQCLTLLLECVSGSDVCGCNDDYATGVHLSPSNDDAVRELFRNQRQNNSSTTSSVRCDIKELLCEMKEQEKVINSLKCALNEAQQQVNLLTNKCDTASPDGSPNAASPRYPFGGDQTDCGRLVNKSPDSTNSCDKLLEELKQLREQSQCDKRAMSQLEEEMNCLMSDVNTRQSMVGEKDDSIKVLKDQLKCIEECFLLGFNSLISSSNNQGSCNQKSDRFQRWKTELIDKISKTYSTLTDVETQGVCFKKEREELLNHQCVLEQKIKCLREQLIQSQDAKEKILEKMCAIEMVQDSAAEQIKETINKKNTNMIHIIIDKIMCEIKCLSGIVGGKEQQFMQLESDLACLHRNLTCAEKELTFSSNKSGGSLYTSLCHLEKDLCSIIRKTKDYIAQCKESERSACQVRNRILMLLSEFQSVQEPSANNESQILEPNIEANLVKKPVVFKEDVHEESTIITPEAKYTESGDSNKFESQTLDEVGLRLCCLLMKLNEIVEDLECTEDDSVLGHQRKVMFNFQHKDKLSVISHCLTEVIEYVKEHRCAMVNEDSSTNKDMLAEHDEAMKKLQADLAELNEQLRCRDKLICTQEDTINVLQNSLQIQQEEVSTLTKKLEEAVQSKEESENSYKMVITELQHKACHLEQQSMQNHEKAQEMKNKMNITCNVLFTELKNHFKDSCNEMVWQIEAADCLNEANSELTKTVKQLQEELENVEKKYVASKLEQEVVCKELCAWKAVVEDIKTEVKTLKDTNMALENEKASLLEQCQNNQSNQAENLKEEMDLLQKAKEEKCNEIAILQNTLDEKCLDICKLQACIEGKCTEIKLLYSQVEKLNNQLNTYNTPYISKSEKVLKSGKSACETLCSDKKKTSVQCLFETSVSDNNGFTSTTSSICDHLTQSETTGSKDQMKSVQFENFSLKNKIVELNLIISELQTELLHKESTFRQREGQEYLNTCERNKENEEKIKHLACQLYQAEEKYNRLQFELSLACNEVEREKNISQVYCQRIDELRTSVGDKSLEANRWESQYHDVRRKLVESQNIQACQNKEIGRLNELICTFNREESISQQQANICEEKVKNANERISKLLSALGCVKCELLELKEERIEKENQIAMLLGKQEELQQIHQRLFDEFTTQICTQEERIKELELELRIMTEEVISKQAEIQESADRENSIKEIVSQKELEWMQRITDGQTEVHRLTDILSGLKENLCFAKSQLELERNQNACDQQRLTEALECIEQLKAEISDKDCNLAKLQSLLCKTDNNCTQHVRRIEQLECCLHQWRQETYELRNTLTKVLKDRADCEEEICKKTEEIKRIHAEMNKAYCDNEKLSKEVSVNRKKTHIRHGENEFSENENILQNEVFRLKACLHSIYIQIGEQRKDFEQELENRKECICRLKNELDCLNLCHEKTKACLIEKEETIKKMQMMSDDSVRKKLDDCKLLSEQLAKAKKEKCCLEKETHQMAEMIQTLQYETLSKDSILMNIEKKLGELESALKCQMQENSILNKKLNQAVDTKIEADERVSKRDCQIIKLKCEIHKIIESFKQFRFNVTEQIENENTLQQKVTQLEQMLLQKEKGNQIQTISNQGDCCPHKGESEEMKCTIYNLQRTLQAKEDKIRNLFTIVKKQEEWIKQKCDELRSETNLVDQNEAILQTRANDTKVQFHNEGNYSSTNELNSVTVLPKAKENSNTVFADRLRRRNPKNVGSVNILPSITKYDNANNIKSGKNLNNQDSRTEERSLRRSLGNVDVIDQSASVLQNVINPSDNLRSGDQRLLNNSDLSIENSIDDIGKPISKSGGIIQLLEGKQVNRNVNYGEKVVNVVPKVTSPLNNSEETSDDSDSTFSSDGKTNQGGWTSDRKPIVRLDESFNNLPESERSANFQRSLRGRTLNKIFEEESFNLLPQVSTSAGATWSTKKDNEEGNIRNLGTTRITDDPSSSILKITNAGLKSSDRANANSNIIGNQSSQFRSDSNIDDNLLRSKGNSRMIDQGRKTAASCDEIYEYNADYKSTTEKNKNNYYKPQRRYLSPRQKVIKIARYVNCSLQDRITSSDENNSC